MRRRYDGRQVCHHLRHTTLFCDFHRLRADRQYYVEPKHHRAGTMRHFTSHVATAPAIPRTALKRKLTRTQRATTAVEFAVCALALVLVVVGFAEFGRLVWTSEVLQEAASEG